MPSATASALPPSQRSIQQGEAVYASTHVAAILNDSGHDVPYALDVELKDDLGNRQTQPTQFLTAPGGGTEVMSSPVYTLKLRAALYTPGQAVTFTATTTVSGQVADTTQQVNTVTIE